MKLLSPEIMNGDDYQLIYEITERDAIISRHVMSNILKYILSLKNSTNSYIWNLYILTSTQTNCDPSESYLFLYDKRQELYSGRSVDYKTVEIEDTQIDETLGLSRESVRMNLYQMLGGDPKYKKHAIIITSW
jgi:hypothetical protein